VTAIVDNKEVEKIADFLTDDPDIFNEMAVSTGAIAMGPGNVPTRTRKKKKRRRTSEDDEPENKPIGKYHANPVTGQPEEGEVLYSDTQSEETDDTVD
jgi:hypothetical protein